MSKSYHMPRALAKPAARGGTHGKSKKAQRRADRQALSRMTPALLDREV